MASSGSGGVSYEKPPSNEDEEIMSEDEGEEARAGSALISVCPFSGT